MRNIFIFWCVATLASTGCASAAPSPPVSVAPEPVIAGAPPETAAQQPAPTSKPHATGTPEDARNHMIRGMAAIKMAKSTDYLALAEDEFRMATEIAPRMAIAWFNLGKAQTQGGHYAEAMDSYRQYLALAPDAKDAQSVRDEIVELQFRQELAAKAQARAGIWVGRDGTGYSLSLNGDRLTIKTDKRLVPQDEAVFDNDARPIGIFTPAEYQLTLRGNHLSGTWNRGGITNLICTFPSDTSEATGELNDKDGRMVLHHDRTSYHAYTQFNLLGNDACTGVNASVRGMVDETIYGPLAKGGVGIELYGLTGWYDGGFSDIRHGWQGRLRAAKVRPGTPAFEAGMQDGDEILAIDGVAVSSLSAGEVVVRLRGEPGSTVTLEISRKDNKKSFSVTMRRIKL